MLILVSAISFLLVNLAPGGPSSLMRMDATPEQRQALATRLGLDQPIPVRYVQWLGGALHGDLGTSLSSNEPVAFRIEQRLPNTLELALTALVVSIALGIPLGMIAALRRNSIPDFLVAAVSVVGLSVPAFWLGIVLILVLSVELNLLPSSGVATTGSEGDLSDRLQHLIMPAVVLSTTVLPYVVRFTRSAMLEVLGQEYVRTATAQGLSRLRVVYGHALRNALVQVVSIIGTLVPRLVGGSVVTEAVFGWPGMGRLAVEAANGRDYPLIVGITVLVSAIVVLTSFVVDIAYTWLDPRILLRMTTAAGTSSLETLDGVRHEPVVGSETSRRGGSVWTRLARNRLSIVALAVLLALHVLVFIGPLVWTVSPEKTSALDALLPPGPGHPLGTDDLGRDELSRLLRGGQVTLVVGFAAMITATVLGLLVGAVAAFYGGWIDALRRAGLEVVRSRNEP